eukprot:TRINITY_DN12028_c0_g1_i4.p1 TRINITY_DN12028_c0_g1~~TRINITY_DN12028_c0_g1_i4.p1  ORF type:complete len:2706 (+),score=550.80 TRINITY_DN12028_c0_g1_i4:61-8178(+)
MYGEDKPSESAIRYFAIIGVSEKAVAGAAAGERVPVEVLQRYPLVDHEDLRFPQSFSAFCFPLGGAEVRALGEIGEVEETLHGFVLTNEACRFSFGAALTVWCADLSGRFLVQRALAIIGGQPHWSAFRAFLCSLRSAGEAFERYVVNFVAETPLPPPGFVVVVDLPPNSLNMGSVELRHPPPNQLPLLDLPVRLVFELLKTPENVVSLVEALLMEQRIVLHSRCVSILSAFGEILVGLIWPLRLAAVYVPLLPNALVEFCGAPMPFVLGIVSDVVKRAEAICEPQTIFVDIDNGTMHVHQEASVSTSLGVGGGRMADRRPQGGPYPRAPDRPRKKLLKRIQQALDGIDFQVSEKSIFFPMRSTPAVAPAAGPRPRSISNSKIEAGVTTPASSLGRARAFTSSQISEVDSVASSAELPSKRLKMQGGADFGSADIEVFSSAVSRGAATDLTDFAHAPNHVMAGEADDWSASPAAEGEKMPKTNECLRAAFLWFMTDLLVDHSKFVGEKFDGGFDQAGFLAKCPDAERPFLKELTSAQMWAQWISHRRDSAGKGKEAKAEFTDVKLFDDLIAEKLNRRALTWNKVATPFRSANYSEHAGSHKVPAALSTPAASMDRLTGNVVDCASWDWRLDESRLYQPRAMPNLAALMENQRSSQAKLPITFTAPTKPADPHDPLQPQQIAPLVWFVQHCWLLTWAAFLPDSPDAAGLQWAKMDLCLAVLQKVAPGDQRADMPPPNDVALRLLVEACARCGAVRIDLARRLLAWMRARRLKVSIHAQSDAEFWGKFISQCASDSGQADGARAPLPEQLPKRPGSDIEHQSPAKSSGLASGVGRGDHDNQLSREEKAEVELLGDLASRPRLPLGVLSGATKATLSHSGRCPLCNRTRNLEKDIFPQWMAAKEDDNHAICRSCHRASPVKLEVFAADVGKREIDLLHPKRLAILLKERLDSATTASGGLGPSCLASLATESPELWANLLWYFRSHCLFDEHLLALLEPARQPEAAMVVGAQGERAVVLEGGECMQQESSEEEFVPEPVVPAQEAMDAVGSTFNSQLSAASPECTSVGTGPEAWEDYELDLPLESGGGSTGDNTSHLVPSIRQLLPERPRLMSLGVETPNTARSTRSRQGSRHGSKGRALDVAAAQQASVEEGLRMQREDLLSQLWRNEEKTRRRSSRQVESVVRQTLGAAYGKVIDDLALRLPQRPPERAGMSEEPRAQESSRPAEEPTKRGKISEAARLAATAAVANATTVALCRILETACQTGRELAESKGVLAFHGEDDDPLSVSAVSGTAIADPLCVADVPGALAAESPGMSSWASATSLPELRPPQASLQAASAAPAEPQSSESPSAEFSTPWATPFLEEALPIAATTAPADFLPPPSPTVIPFMRSSPEAAASGSPTAELSTPWATPLMAEAIPMATSTWPAEFLPPLSPETGLAPPTIAKAPVESPTHLPTPYATPLSSQTSPLPMSGSPAAFLPPPSPEGRAIAAASAQAEPYSPMETLAPPSPTPAAEASSSSVTAAFAGAEKETTIRVTPSEIESSEEAAITAKDMHPSLETSTIPEEQNLLGIKSSPPQQFIRCTPQWEAEDEDTPLSASVGHRFHAFMSHEWGEGGQNHLKVAEICRRLQERGISCWLDEEQKEGCSPRNVSEGIDSSEVFVAFITEAYHDRVASGAGQDIFWREWQHAEERQKDVVCVPMDPWSKDASNYRGSIRKKCFQKSHQASFVDEQVLDDQVATLERQIRCLLPGGDATSTTLHQHLADKDSVEEAQDSDEDSSFSSANVEDLLEDSSLQKPGAEQLWDLQEVLRSSEPVAGEDFSDDSPTASEVAQWRFEEQTRRNDHEATAHKASLLQQLHDTGLVYELRVVADGDENLQGTSECELNFPTSLGWYDAKSVKMLRPKDIEFSAEADGSFRVQVSKTSDPRITKLLELVSPTECAAAKSSFASASPKYAISLTGADRLAACIPEDATTYSFCLPFRAAWAVAKSQDLLDIDSADLNFLRVGGFVYFDASDNVMAIFALCPASSGKLRFMEAKTLNTEEAAHLKTSGRFSPLTAGGFAGAGYMAWTGVDEEATSNTLGRLVFTPPDMDIPYWSLQMMLTTNGLFYPLNVEDSWSERFPKFIMPFKPSPTHEIQCENLKIPDLSTVGWGKRCVEIQMISESPAIRFVEPSGVLHGRMSPFSRLTLTEDLLDEAKIQKGAVKFAYCYPWDIDWEHVRERAVAEGFAGKVTEEEAAKHAEVKDVWCHAGGADVDLCFLQVGGYLYFDRDNRLIQINAPRLRSAIFSTYKGAALRFGAPRMLLPEWVRALEAAERWAPVTLPELKKGGAARFVWLRSSNFEPDLSGFASKHGGFAYIGAGGEQLSSDSQFLQRMIPAMPKEVQLFSPTRAPLPLVQEEVSENDTVGSPLADSAIKEPSPPQQNLRSALALISTEEKSSRGAREGQDESAAMLRREEDEILSDRFKVELARLRVAGDARRKQQIWRIWRKAIVEMGAKTETSDEDERDTRHLKSKSGRASPQGVRRIRPGISVDIDGLSSCCSSVAASPASPSRPSSQPYQRAGEKTAVEAGQPEEVQEGAKSQGVQQEQQGTRVPALGSGEDPTQDSPPLLDACSALESQPRRRASSAPPERRRKGLGRKQKHPLHTPPSTGTDSTPTSPAEHSPSSVRPSPSRKGALKAQRPSPTDPLGAELQRKLDRASNP